MSLGLSGKVSCPCMLCPSPQKVRAFHGRGPPVLEPDLSGRGSYKANLKGPEG